MGIKAVFRFQIQEERHKGSFITMDENKSELIPWVNKLDQAFFMVHIVNVLPFWHKLFWLVLR